MTTQTQTIKTKRSKPATMPRKRGRPRKQPPRDAARLLHDLKEHEERVADELTRVRNAIDALSTGETLEVQR